MVNQNAQIGGLVGRPALTQISKLCVGDPAITAAIAVTLLKEAAAKTPAEDSIFGLGRRVNAAIARLAAPEAHVEAVRELRNTNDALGIIPLLGLHEHNGVVCWIAREAADPKADLDLRSAAAWILVKLAEQSAPGFHFSAEQGNAAIVKGVKDSLAGGGHEELHKMFLKLASYLSSDMAPAFQGRIATSAMVNEAARTHNDSSLLRLATKFGDASETVLLLHRDRRALSDLRSSFELGGDSLADSVVNIVARGSAGERASLAELLVDHLGDDPYSTQQPTQEKLLRAVWQLVVKDAPEFEAAIKRLTYLATMERFGVHRQMISVISAWSENAGKAARSARIWPGFFKRALFKLSVCLQRDSHRSWNRGDLDTI